MPVTDVFTDSNGLYSFYGLPNENYYLVIEAEDFRPVRQSVMLDLRINPRVQANVVLEPLQKKVEDPSPVISGSPKSYEVNARDFPRPRDPRALREFERGNEKQQAGNFKSALSHYQKALQIEPDFYPALNNLGAIYEREKDHPRAEAAFMKSVEINPRDGAAYINLGHLLFEEGRYRPAIERLEQGLERAPESAVGHFFLGSTYMKLGDLEKAEPNLKTATALDPSRMAAAHLQLANLYLKRREVDAACVELESYLQANPSDPQAPAIKKTLADLKAHRTN